MTLESITARRTHVMQLLILLTSSLIVAAGCAALGYSNRVLWRVPSPDGGVVAVCQEIPAFDGPRYDVRLETQDGTLVRELYETGDADGCSEIAWSADGRTLGILTSHVARIKFVDVAWALAHRDIPTAYWSWRDVDLSTEHRRLEGADLHFIGATTVQLNVGEAIRRFEIPLPIVTGHK